VVENRMTVWLMAAGFGVPGGIEAHILHYASEMRRRGWSPCVVIFDDFPQPSHRFMDALDAAQIPRCSIGRQAFVSTMLRFLIRMVPWCLVQVAKGRWPRLGMLWNWQTAHAQVGVLKQRCARDQPDVIHVFGRLPHLAWAALPTERTIFHQMMTGDIDGEWTTDEIEGFVGFSERCAAFLAPGAGVAANLRRVFGIKRDISTVFTLCPDAVGGEHAQKMIQDRLAFQAKNSCLRFGVICRLTEQKGISFLLDALLAYKYRHGDVHFAFAGQGDLENVIRQFVVRNELRNVTVETVRDPASFLSQIDVFVHPSVGDAMPMAIAEAMMCGLPCIVSRVGGCPDLVRDGEDGFVIEPRRTDQILERMERFSAMSPHERADVSASARRRFEMVCLPGPVGDVVEKYYQAIVDGK